MSLETLFKRVSTKGSSTQERMIYGKLDSFKAAIKASYHKGLFKKIVNGKEEEDEIEGLLEEASVTMTYDSKMVSVLKEADFQQGTYFKWSATNTVWIILTQYLTELAYFRAICRKCNYKIKWVDADRELQEEYLSIVGSTISEFLTSSASNANISMDIGNENLSIFVQDNPRNRAFFQRYQSLLIEGSTYRIENIDIFSISGVIKIKAIESFGNRIEDDVELNIRNAFNVQPVIEQDGSDIYIDGPNEILPSSLGLFSVPFAGGEWSIESTPANSARLGIGKDPKKAAVEWIPLKSGTFVLTYSLEEKVYRKTVYVKSLT